MCLPYGNDKFDKMNLDKKLIVFQATKFFKCESLIQFHETSPVNPASDSREDK